MANQKYFKCLPQKIPTYKYEKPCWRLRLKVSHTTYNNLCHNRGPNEALISAYSYTKVQPLSI